LLTEGLELIEHLIEVLELLAAQGLELLNVKLLVKAPTAVDELGAALLESGCAAQFERLANATKVPATAP
jgi:hypothetical protein